MGRRQLVLALLCTALLAPASAAAQLTTPLPQPLPEQPAPAPVDTSAGDEDDGLSRAQELLIGAAGLVLLLGIAWAIVRDARSAAPVEERGGPPGLDPDRPKGSRTPPKRRVQRSRAKAKAARQARKRAKRGR